MSNLIIFNNMELNVKVRSITDAENNYWFILRDVLTAMGTKTKPSDAKNELINVFGKGGVKFVPLETAGGIQNTIIINEVAITYLISRGRTETSKRLNRWLHAEVLPTIRKTGGYIQENRAIDFVDSWLPNLDDTTKQAIASTLETNRKLLIENKEQVKQIEELSTENERIKNSVGIGNEWKQVKALNKMITKLFDVSNRSIYSIIGRQLRKLSDHMGYDVYKTPDVEWGSVNVYHVDVCREYFTRLIVDKTLLTRYRKKKEK